MERNLTEQYVIQVDAHHFLAAMKQTGPDEVSVIAKSPDINNAQIFPDFFSQRIDAIRKKHPHALYMKVQEVKMQRTIIVLNVQEPGGE